MPTHPKPRSRRNTPRPTAVRGASAPTTTPPVATRVGIPMLRAAYDSPTDGVSLATGHASLPILELRSDLSHGGHRFQRWLIAKANRAHIAALFASSVSDYDRPVPPPTAHDILEAAANAVRP